MMLGFNPFSEYKRGHIYTSNKKAVIVTFDRVDLKCDCIDGRIVHGIKQGVNFSFALDDFSGIKIYVNLKQYMKRKTNLI